MRTLLRSLIIVAVLAGMTASASAWVWNPPDHPAPGLNPLDYWYQYVNTGVAFEWVPISDPYNWGPPIWESPERLWVPNWSWHQKSKYIWWENVYPIGTPLPPDDPRILLVEDDDNGVTQSLPGVNWDVNMYDMTWTTILPIQPWYEIITVPDPLWAELFDSEYMTPIDWIDIGTWCPEPATLSLIGLGVGSLLLRRRRRR